MKYCVVGLRAFPEGLPDITEYIYGKTCKQAWYDVFMPWQPVFIIVIAKETECTVDVVMNKQQDR